MTSFQLSTRKECKKSFHVSIEGLHQGMQCKNRMYVYCTDYKTSGAMQFLSRVLDIHPNKGSKSIHIRKDGRRAIERIRLESLEGVCTQVVAGQGIHSPDCGCVSCELECTLPLHRLYVKQEPDPEHVMYVLVHYSIPRIHYDICQRLVSTRSIEEFHSLLDDALSIPLLDNTPLVVANNA